MRIAGLVLMGWFTWMAGTTISQTATIDSSVQNAALIRAHHDALNRGDLKTALTYFALNTKISGSRQGAKVSGAS